jgi:hypothetical protein
MNKNSTRILVIAVIAAVLSTALVVSQPASTSAAQQIKAAGETIEKNNDDNDQSKTVSAEHGNSSTHIPSFAASNSNLNQTKITELRIAIHDLWVEHVVWTRQYVVAAAADSPDAGFAAERLLKNQEDIGDAIKPFYGDQAGDQLTLLLKDHITIAVDLLEAAKIRDSAAVEEIEKKWYNNADDIATFLSEANPNWAKEELASMLNEHLSLTKTEAVARLTGDYATDVATFDSLYVHAVSMGDEFTVGIVKQFQERFEVDRNGAGAN